MPTETNADYAAYRQQCTQEAQEYQDFICAELHKHGIVLQNMTSRTYQYRTGENLFGLEIKYDRRVSETGRLYIETEEKAFPREGPYAPAGIYRDDNSWLYGIGDYRQFYIFGKKHLRRVDKASPEWLYRPFSDKATSRGFCIPLAKAMEMAEKYFLFAQEDAT